MEITNYNKENMQELKNEIATKKNEYKSLIESLERNIQSMHEYWVEGDQTAEAVYARLIEQFNQFKKDLEEGYELMSKYEQRVNDQVGNYEEAEKTVMSRING